MTEELDEELFPEDFEVEIDGDLEEFLNTVESDVFIDDNDWESYF